MHNIFLRLKLNKIAIFIILLISSIIAIIYSNFQSNKLNASILDSGSEDPYLLVTKGSAIIKRGSIITLREKERSLVMLGDKIRTFEKSEATLFWPDGSVTRLGEKTAITINEMKTDKSLSSIRIRFDISQGKTWSNIIKFLNKDSIFSETYEDGNYAATVRGTVFEINLDESYIHAVNHDVMLTDNKNDTTTSVPQGGAKNLFDIKTVVPEEVWDKDWIDENMKADIDYLKANALKWKAKLESMVKDSDFGTETTDFLKSKIGNPSSYVIGNISRGISTGDMSQLQKMQDYISGLSPEEKANVNEKLKSFYQNIHSLPDEGSLPENKSYIRNMIIDTSSDTDKKDLLERFARLDIYDYAELSKRGADAAASVIKKNINIYLSQIDDPEAKQKILDGFSKEMLDMIGVDFSELDKEIGIMKQRINDESFKKEIKKNIIKSAADINEKLDNTLSR